MAEIEVFVAQWGLDSNAHAALASLPKHVQEKVATNFQPKPGTRDVHRLFHSFLKSVQNPGGKGMGKGMSKGAPTAAQAFGGGFGGGFPPAASRAPAPDGFFEHWESWGLDDSALAMLIQQPPEVKERVLAEFSPKPGTRDINRLIHSFVRLLRTSRFPHLQAPGAGSEQAKPQAKRASQTAGSKSKPNRRQKEQAQPQATRASLTAGFKSKPNRRQQEQAKPQATR